jgi:hypothetical protein
MFRGNIPAGSFDAKSSFYEPIQQAAWKPSTPIRFKKYLKVLLPMVQGRTSTPPPSCG